MNRFGSYGKTRAEWTRVKGRMDEWMDGWMDGRTDGQMEGRRDE